MPSKDEVQLHFLKLLTQLSEREKVEWARSETEVGFAYCSAGQELIIFEVRGGGHEGRLVDPAEGADGIVAKCRNISYLWLPVTPGFDDLRALLEKAPVDSGKFARLRNQAYSVPLQVLESLL